VGFLKRKSKKGHSISKSKRHHPLCPPWATAREGWRFAGWISRQGNSSKTFEELVERTIQSDHGEVREIDIYEQGAVCWIKERD
jgi:hypothetical protein